MAAVTSREHVSVVPAVELMGVSIIRQGRRTLDDVTFRINPDEHWAVIGPNGAGKSTLLAVCATVTWPSLGTLHVFGEQLGRLEVSRLREHIGYVTAHHQLEWPLTAREVVMTALTNTLELPMRWSPTLEQSAVVDAQLGLFGLSDVAHTPWRGLSQGELGRTLLARAMLRRPRLLLLDEPAAGLDLGAREQLLEVLSDHVASTPGLASVMVTHHLEELPVTTTHAVLMSNGKVVHQGPATEVLTVDHLTRAYGFAVDVRREDGRWSWRRRR